MGKRRLLMTGATGLLGAAAVPILSAAFECIPIGRSRDLDHANFERLDLEDRSRTTAVLERLQPDVILHAAALANVEACEAEQARAHATNVETTRHLAHWVAERRPATTLVYISTDQVYDGPGEHGEDVVAPCNVYGLTKLWGEDLCRRLPRHLVLRTNFFAIGAGPAVGLAAWLIDALGRQTPITVFDDVYFNPLYGKDLADILCSTIEAGLIGTYNVGASGGGMSKAEFALGLAEILGLPFAAARRGSVAGAAMKARRPNDMRMSVQRLTAELGTTLPTTRDGLARLAADFAAASGQAKA